MAPAAALWAKLGSFLQAAAGGTMLFALKGHKLLAALRTNYWHS
ncbi:hypothetical protein [Limosilactobacillus oris]|nr:hypothetical protein [Limosilactobacillus oris]WHO85202.1 hypothetical protein QLX69_07485 [Limosilactobacillus oris]